MYQFLQRSCDSSSEGNVKKVFLYVGNKPSASSVIEQLNNAISRRGDALCQLNKQQLVQLLQAFNAKGLSKMNKAQLVHRLGLFLQEKAPLVNEETILRLMKQQS